MTTRFERLRTDVQPRNKHYDIDTKMRILALTENHSPSYLAKAFGISIQTIYNWGYKYDRDGRAGLEDSPKSGRRPVLTTAQISECMDTIRDRNEVVTSRAVQKEILAVHKRSFSLEGVRKMLARAGMTRKKMQPVHVKTASLEKIAEWMEENIPIIAEYMEFGHVLGSGDESNAKLDDEGRYGYSRRGERIYGKYEEKQQGITITGVVTQDGRSVFRTSHKANSESFLNVLRAVSYQIGKAVILEDNASYHRSKKVTDWLDKHPEIKLIYLPVGCPFMNIIESVWALLKSHLRETIFETKEDFVKAVSKYLRVTRFELDVLSKLYDRLPIQAMQAIGTAT